MNTGGSIVGSHDSYKQPFSDIYPSLRWVGYGNVLLANNCSPLLVFVNVGMIADLFTGTPASLASNSRELVF
jgi:hypothetical protein